MIEYETLRFRTLVDQYMLTKKSQMVISIAAASKALLTVMPEFPAGDRELSELIAAAAVKHGYAVSFDLEAAAPGHATSSSSA